ncbi:MAG TPA: hypothetical protein VFM29_00770, partial [Vicinamibacteria bacterium]|nr:hypothetical protein [Vicinamibacteria bacterium]
MIAAGALALLVAAAPSPPPSPGPAVALVGGEIVSAAELEARAAPRLIEARTREYEERRRAL